MPTLDELLSAARSVITEDDIKLIVAEAILKAKMGDDKARQFIAKIAFPENTDDESTEKAKTVVFELLGKIEESD